MDSDTEEMFLITQAKSKGKKMIHFAINIHLVTDCEIKRITPVNPCTAETPIAKDFIKQT